MTHDPTLYAKYSRRAADAFAARDYDHACPPDPLARQWRTGIDDLVHQMFQNCRPPQPHVLEVGAGEWEVERG